VITITSPNPAGSRGGESAEGDARGKTSRTSKRSDTAAMKSRIGSAREGSDRRATVSGGTDGGEGKGWESKQKRIDFMREKRNYERVLQRIYITRLRVNGVSRRIATRKRGGGGALVTLMAAEKRIT